MRSAAREGSSAARLSGAFHVTGFSPRRAATAALSVLVTACLVASGCGRPESAAGPDRIVVQHLLVSFAGKLPGKNVQRTEAQARALAQQLLERARAGESFDDLVRKYTDD